jgi:hypothetical protein
VAAHIEQRALRSVRQLQGLSPMERLERAAWEGEEKIERNRRRPPLKPVYSA